MQSLEGTFIDDGLPKFDPIARGMADRQPFDVAFFDKFCPTTAERSFSVSGLVFDRLNSDHPVIRQGEQVGKDSFCLPGQVGPLEEFVIDQGIVIVFLNSHIGRLGAGANMFNHGLNLLESDDKLKLVIDARQTSRLDRRFS